jgi:soluble cytochrome b562
MTMRIKQSLLALLVATLAATQAAAADPAEIRATLKTAEATHQQALELEHGWSATVDLIEEARSALESGDLDTAQERAGRALLAAEQSVVQAETEAKTWQQRVVGN